VLVVDSGVWIDYFNNAAHPAVDQLDEVLGHGEVRIVVPDLVLFEVLRGFRTERSLREARLLLDELDVEPLGGVELARTAAAHYRDLRRQGVTIRSGIDVLIASFCIEHDYALLHRDRDFRTFETHRGLRGWVH
jgi:predicted nucleic acid-binding protein